MQTGSVGLGAGWCRWAGFWQAAEGPRLLLCERLRRRYMAWWNASQPRVTPGQDPALLCLWAQALQPGVCEVKAAEQPWGGSPSCVALVGQALLVQDQTVPFWELLPPQINSAALYL